MFLGKPVLVNIWSRASSSAVYRQRCPFCAHAGGVAWRGVAWRGVARSEPLNPLGPSGNKKKKDKKRVPGRERYHT